MSKIITLLLVSSILNAILYPKTIIYNTRIIISITIINLINHLIIKYKLAHPSNTNINKYIDILGILMNIGILSYIDCQYNYIYGMIDNIGKLINMFNWSLNYLSYSIIHYLYILNCLATGMIILVPLFNMRLRPYFVIINRLIDFSRQLNLAVSFAGVNILLNSAATTRLGIINEEQLDKCCPLRCPGLNNQLRNNSTEFANPNNCSICMEIYDEKQLTRTLPCHHSFHAYCVDPWLLQRSADCPICRRNIIN